MRPLPPTAPCPMLCLTSPSPPQQPCDLQDSLSLSLSALPPITNDVNLGLFGNLPHSGAPLPGICHHPQQETPAFLVQWDQALTTPLPPDLWSLALGQSVQPHLARAPEATPWHPEEQQQGPQSEKEAGPRWGEQASSHCVPEAVLCAKGVGFSESQERARGVRMHALRSGGSIGAPASRGLGSECLQNRCPVWGWRATQV